jgi:hypothetical protein
MFRWFESDCESCRIACRLNIRTPVPLNRSAAPHQFSSFMLPPPPQETSLALSLHFAMGAPLIDPIQRTCYRLLPQLEIAQKWAPALVSDLRTECTDKLLRTVMAPSVDVVSRAYCDSFTSSAAQLQCRCGHARSPCATHPLVGRTVGHAELADWLEQWQRRPRLAHTGSERGCDGIQVQQVCSFASLRHGTYL